MQVSRIEQKIEDIYAFVENCKMQHLSTTKVIVPKNELYDLLDDLRRDAPEEIGRYRKMLDQRDAILEKAHATAQEIIDDAKDQYRRKVEEHAIVQQAYAQAQEILAQAQQEAQAIVGSAKGQAAELAKSAIEYTVDQMNSAEKIISNAYESTVNNSKALETALRGHLEIIRHNREELISSNSPAAENVESADAAAAPERAGVPADAEAK